MDWGLFIDKILPVIIAGGGVYAAIRADLREAHILAKLAGESANKAHERIDKLLKGSHQ
jgi:hypothetical protein